MYCHQECSKREVTIYLKREGTIHRGHRLHSVSLLGCVCVCVQSFFIFIFYYLYFNGVVLAVLIIIVYCSV
jgi:hypothetical protein